MFKKIKVLIPSLQYLVTPDSCFYYHVAQRKQLAPENKHTLVYSSRHWSHHVSDNRQFPSSKKSHFQSDAKCETFVGKMSFNYDANKTHYHNKGFALSLVLKVGFFGTRKWPICVNGFVNGWHNPTWTSQTLGHPRREGVRVGIGGGWVWGAATRSSPLGVYFTDFLRPESFFF